MVELVDEEVVVQVFFSKLYQVLMVGEEDDLRVFGQPGQRFERRDSTVVVEHDQYVVDNEGDRLVVREVGFEQRETQRQIQLVARAVTHAVDADRSLVVGTDAD